MGAFLFSRVELLRPLGESGQHAAHATSTMGTELVVVDPLTDPAALARARVLADVSHPNLSAVRDVGIDRVLSEFVDGERLERLGNVPLEIALRIAIDVLAALGAMHASGIVHGNVRPENVIVGADGITRLVRGWRSEIDDRNADLRGVGEFLTAAIDAHDGDWAQPLEFVAERARGRISEYG